MELFTKSKVVKLRSHFDKYLVSDDDQETVRQSRNGASHGARWFVELVEPKKDVIRLRSCHGKYLTASDIPFLLGMTGKKVLQTSLENNTDWKLAWEPIRDGFQVKFKSWCGKFLRANGVTPPWKNSITHDEPHMGATQRWILWEVEAVELPETESLQQYLLSMSSFSSVSEDVLEAASDDYLGSGPGSPVRRPRLTVFKSMSRKKANSNYNRFQSGMQLFHNAKTVRLCSHHDKYLHAEDNEESVTQDRNGSSKNAKWTVECVTDSIIRLKSCYGKYLTASNIPFLFGMTGRKVLQTLPSRLDSSVEWEPIREGTQIKLKTRYGNFLRANGILPPWRNSVTHDIPHRTATQDWLLWDVDVVEIQVKDHQDKAMAPPDSSSFESSSPSSGSVKSGHFSRQESSDSNASSITKSEGRTIYYHVIDENGEVDDDDVGEGYSMVFKGNGIDGLTQKLREETGLQDIVVCTRSPLNGMLYPLRLQLPPNNADMHIVVVQSSSKDVSLARDFAKQGIAL